MTSNSLENPLISTIFKTLISFTLLRVCSTVSFFNFDLSTTPLDPTTDGFAILGNAADDYFGRFVNTAGDIDNDGYDDIIIGAFGKNTFAGAAYVIYGGPKSSLADIDLSTTSLNPQTTGFMITGNAEYLGLAVGTAGDIDKDGYDDIIIGGYGKNIQTGAVYVIYGGKKSSMTNINLNTDTLYPLTTGFTIKGNAYGDSLGFSANTAGDINNDGYADIIIGAYGKSTAYVIYGGPRSSMSNIDLSTTTLNPLLTGFTITTGAAGGDNLGYSVSTAGDINKDGYSDVIIGASAFTSGGLTSQGAAFVIYGGKKSSMANIDLSSGSLSLTVGFMVKGNAQSDQLGISVNTAGDINNDGYSDMIIGASGKSSSTGAAYVIYGGEKSSMSNINLASTALDPLTTGFTIGGNSASDMLGRGVGKAGDMNKDGYNDIIVGAYGKNAAYVIYGGPKSSMSDLDLSTTVLDKLTTGFMITGNSASDNFGISVNIAGDIDKNGYPDIIIGAHSKDSGKGAAYIIHTACSPCRDCPINCDACTDLTSCSTCSSSYYLYQSECLSTCPEATFISTDTCKDCPTNCYSCTSQTSCKICNQGYTLSTTSSLCVSLSYQQAQDKASQAISSATQAIGGVFSVGSAVFPLSALVSKTVQNTRYLNLSVTTDLAEIYKSWSTDIISWEVPNIFSKSDHFEISPPLFAQYDIGSPFLSNFWPTLTNIAIGFGTFITCFALRMLSERVKYKGWIYSLLQRLVAGSFNFGLIQVYACMNDVLFYLVIDTKTNPFNSFFSWTSLICAVLFLVLGCLLIFFNFWTVWKYQKIKAEGLSKDNMRNLEAFNERNKYWELFYSDFNDEDLLSQSFFAIVIMRSTLSSCIITVLYDYPLMQTTYLVIIDGVILLFLFFKNPFNTLRGTLAQYYFEIITLLVHLCTFFLAFQDSLKVSSETIRTILSTSIIYLNTALVSGSIGFMFIELYKTLSQKIKAKKLKQYESIAIQAFAEENLDSSQNQYLDTQVQRKQETWVNHDQSSFENFHLLSRSQSNIVLPNLNMESSPIKNSNLNDENLVLSDINPSQQKSQNIQNIVPIFIRRKLKIFRPQDKSVIEGHKINDEQFENI